MPLISCFDVVRDIWHSRYGINFEYTLASQDLAGRERGWPVCILPYIRTQETVFLVEQLPIGRFQKGAAERVARLARMDLVLTRVQFRCSIPCHEQS
jgi:hypothetical protein